MYRNKFGPTGNNLEKRICFIDPRFIKQRLTSPLLFATSLHPAQSSILLHDLKAIRQAQPDAVLS